MGFSSRLSSIPVNAKRDLSERCGCLQLISGKYFQCRHLDLCQSPETVIFEESLHSQKTQSESLRGGFLLTYAHLVLARSLDMKSSIPGKNRVLTVVFVVTTSGDGHAGAIY